ncbi:hypothetical protein ALIPUT_00065 [Alistipes putredinis DSM 17216]|uniref:Uncharacterized protein n=1 Tax=Alistipes putredinis DSM 17216 TaxID=445970 RepID=B0MTH7_9BACT|nr:hypothetical protein ALIPUT_00065 [Alistipes putredinis DSM 17216]
MSPQSFPDFVSEFPVLPEGAFAAGGKRFRIPVWRGVAPS